LECDGSTPLCLGTACRAREAPGISAAVMSIFLLIIVDVIFTVLLYFTGA